MSRADERSACVWLAGMEPGESGKGKTTYRTAVVRVRSDDLFFNAYIEVQPHRNALPMDSGGTGRVHILAERRKVS